MTNADVVVSACSAGYLVLMCGIAIWTYRKEGQRNGKRQNTIRGTERGSPKVVGGRQGDETGQLPDGGQEDGR